MEPAKPKINADDLVRARTKIGVFPSAAAELLAHLRDPNASPVKICSVAGRDPVLAASLIRFANSALYSSGCEIRTLERAVSQLGFDQARLLTIAICLKPLFRAPRLQRVWNHSVEVAANMGALAGLSGTVNEDEARVVGLLHDIGQIVLLSPALRYEEELPALKRRLSYDVEIEQAYCGCSHAKVGAQLLVAWSFPPEMVEAVRFHHEPFQSALPFTSLLYLAENATPSEEAPVFDGDRERALQVCGLTGSCSRSLIDQKHAALELVSFAA
jgi:putative nucleotidyltransferase with HDIG domain